jgi:hypothetical protein
MVNNSFHSRAGVGIPKADLGISHSSIVCPYKKIFQDKHKNVYCRHLACGVYAPICNDLFRKCHLYDSFFRLVEQSPLENSAIKISVFKKRKPASYCAFFH